ncbi:MAG: PqqD family protein [Actinobacteria bacterium]|nr:PqqD family protein [Actinomycetota bacterium]
MSTTHEILPEALHASFVPRPRPGLTSVELDGETVIYDEHRRTLHTLNPTATIVWTCLDGTISLAELAVELAEAFSVEPAVVLNDLLDLARELGRQGLLEGVAADPDETAAHQVGPHEAGDVDEDC